MDYSRNPFGHSSGHTPTPQGSPGMPYNQTSRPSPPGYHNPSSGHPMPPQPYLMPGQVPPGHQMFPSTPQLPYPGNVHSMAGPNAPVSHAPLPVGFPNGSRNPVPPINMQPPPPAPTSHVPGGSANVPQAGGGVSGGQGSVNTQAPRDPEAIRSAVQRMVNSPMLSGYTNPQRVIDDTTYIVQNYRTLSFSVAELEGKPLLRLNGFFPVTYQGRPMNVPIDLWFPHQYPDQAPLCFVYTTNPALELRATHPCVLPNGVVHHDYLNDWTAASSLPELVMLLVSSFEDDQSPIVPVGDPLGVTVARTQIAKASAPPIPPRASIPNRSTEAAGSSTARSGSAASSTAVADDASGASSVQLPPPLPESGASEAQIAVALAAAAKADDPTALDEAQRRIVLEQVVLIKAERELKQCWEPVAKELFDLEQRIEPLEHTVADRTAQVKQLKAKTEEIKATADSKTNLKTQYDEWTQAAQASVERIDPLECVTFTQRNVPIAAVPEPLQRTVSGSNLKPPSFIPRGLHGSALLKQMIIKTDLNGSVSLPPFPTAENEDGATSASNGDISPTGSPEPTTTSPNGPNLLAEDLASAAAEDAACHDTLEAMNQFVAEGLISLSDYVRQIRKLARQQYMARSLATKIVALYPELLHQPNSPKQVRSRPAPPPPVPFGSRPNGSPTPGMPGSAGVTAPSSGVYPQAPAPSNQK